MSAPNSTTSTIKFLCSYGGKILPRYPDGKLRYHGGQTRVLSVDRSISFSELLVKLGELCGSSVSVRCQLPTEDLDALVTVTSDEDLVNLIEVYDRESTRQSKSLKIKAFLKLTATATGSGSSSSAGSPKSPLSAANRCIYHISKPPVTPYNKSAGKVRCYAYGYGNPSRSYLVHNGSYWQ